MHRGNAGGCAGARGKTLRRSDICPSRCRSPQSSGSHGCIASRLRGASAREFNSSTTRLMAGNVGAGAEAPLPLLGFSTLTTSEMHLRPGFSNSSMTGCNAIKLSPSASRHLQAPAPPNSARGNARIPSKSPWSSQEKKKHRKDHETYDRTDGRCDLTIHECFVRRQASRNRGHARTHAQAFRTINATQSAHGARFAMGGCPDVQAAISCHCRGVDRRVAFAPTPDTIARLGRTTIATRARPAKACHP